MLLFWALCVSLPTLPAQASGPQSCAGHNSSAQHFSSVMDSLQCYNDYSSHVQCSWMESVRTHSLAPLSLYHLDTDENKESRCLPFGPPAHLPGGQLLVHCRHNTNVFGIGFEEAFFFKTPHSPRLSKTLFLSQHAVRVRPPHSLAHKTTEGRGSVLSWESSYPPSSPLYPTLNYQVNYRRLGQEWTTAEVAARELVIEDGSLVPGCWYEARVRGRGGQGLWSEWSPLVEWETEEAVEPGPSNLQCVFDGETGVTCSWEVKKDLAQFVSYNLSYRTGPTAPVQWCSTDPPVSADSSHLMLRFSCSFSVSKPEKLLVELTPTRHTKVFESYKHIRPTRPSHVQVHERTEEDWELRWTLPKYETVSVYFQVRYWRNEKPEDVKCVNLPEGVQSYLLPAESLHPSTKYTAQVRTLISSKGGWYSGTPSDWTEPMQWTTHPAPRLLSTLVCVVISICTIVLLILLLILTLPTCQRWVKVWEMSIPSPIKSKAVEEVMKKSSNYCVTSHKEIDKILVSDIQVVASDKPAHSPCSSEVSSQPIQLTTADDDGLYQSFDGQGWELVNNPDKLSVGLQTKGTAYMSSREPSALCPRCSRPQGEDTVIWSRVAGRPFDPPPPSYRQTLQQSSSEYMGLPSSETQPSQRSSPRRFPGEIVLQEGYIESCSLLLGSPEPGAQLQSDSDPLNSDANTASPLNILWDLIQQSPDRYPLPGLEMAGFGEGDSTQEREGYLGDIAEDHSYVRLSHT
ncbi:interleukin-3 receptor class 2 subunit beta-like [Megalops cyprinoides]|uniref:interleukin-3 receptor class 2 subunit beta-like n=1 Tax=Megalops cyprinoides TaxID=118141 RepID=UPI001865535F|nr:interleukin-3 receptor class 2 subunit beta-like [Megalops cyprinoides]XP_036397364.1 interleukin-3 receptor class 2 subunit beta-like [Megalops cyprinoides]